MNADVGGDLIWGDDEESQVFAQAQSHDSCTIIFRYALNPKYPQSLSNRIVTCFHQLPAKDASETFASRAAMREELYSSIRQVWDQCIVHPFITAPDVTVEIYEDAQGYVQWRICHESLYNQYEDLLLPLCTLFPNGEVKASTYNFIEYGSLIQVSHLGGRGTTTLVRSSLSSEALYVFKGLDFGGFLDSRANFPHRKNILYHEIKTIFSLPRHANIIPLPTQFVTARRHPDDQKAFICGTLYPFMKHGSLEDQVEKASAMGARLPLSDLAAWCFQMTSAIAHIHFTAHTFHMDIKPANFLVDDNQDLILIDWEQSGAPLCTLAPEADGSWDIKDATSGAAGYSELLYQKYSGPPRENLVYGRPKWNVFPLWRDLYPRALEAAEVFSLGRTMWMLFEQLTQDEVEDHDNVLVFWSEKTKDIPDDWRTVVMACMNSDPNRRMKLMELLDFWESRNHRACLCSVCTSVV
ncbi:MAG: hypothetical protein ASARMPREDX12_005406 [Alectoria sarmentosa]|nr:MAG: hypothetical protein ASARMPREDX12_005406 [Alectoria sarmentosa]